MLPRKRSLAKALVVSFAAFVFVPVLCRIASFLLNWPRSPAESIAIFMQGALEDTAIAFQLLSIALLVSKTLPKRLFFVVIAIILCLAAIPPIVDIAVQMGGFARITRVEIVTTAKHFRHMTSSMVDRILTMESLFYFIAFAVALFHATRFVSGVLRQASSISWNVIAACAFFIVIFVDIAVVVRLLLPRSCAYLAGNVTFSLEFGQAPPPLNQFERWVGARPDLTTILDSSESFEPADLQFPLWRQTTGFSGVKRFNLTLNPNRLPNLLLINMESWGSQVAGQHAWRYSAASLTPHFDRFAADGIAFGAHFNPG
jgi:hypothetical protein